MIPTADQIREFLSPRDTEVESWIIDQLDDLARLIYKKEWKNSHLEHYEYSCGEASADLVENFYNRGDEIHGTVTLTLDELLSQVEDPTERKRAIAELDKKQASENEIRRIQKEQYDRENREKLMKFELSQLAMLKEKYESN